MLSVMVFDNSREGRARNIKLKRWMLLLLYLTWRRNKECKRERIEWNGIKHKMGFPSSSSSQPQILFVIENILNISPAFVVLCVSSNFTASPQFKNDVKASNMKLCHQAKALLLIIVNVHLIGIRHIHFHFVTAQLAVLFLSTQSISNRKQTSVADQQSSSIR